MSARRCCLDGNPRSGLSLLLGRRTHVRRLALALGERRALLGRFGLLGSLTQRVIAIQATTNRRGNEDEVADGL